MITVWLDFDSTTGNPGDVTVTLQLYNWDTAQYGNYYDGSSICAVSASILTSATGIYIDLGSQSAWSWADEARLGVVLSSGTCVMNIYVGGK